MMFDSSARPQGLGPIFCAVARPIHVNNLKLKSYELCTCRYIQWGLLGPGLKFLSFGPKFCI